MKKLYVYISKLSYADIAYKEVIFSILPPKDQEMEELICLGTIDITPLAEEDKGV